MSFLGNLVNEFTHQGQSHNSNQGPPPQHSGGYGSQSSYNNERPQPPAPWIAEWDGRDNRWIFINRETGERSFDFPRQRDAGYGGGYPPRPQGYNEQPYYGGQGQQPQYQQYQQGPPPPQEQHKDHSTRNTALGVAAGLAGGALLMHEGEKIEDRYDEDKYRFEEAKYGMEDRYEEDKYRMENRIDNGFQDVADFPEDAARWTGRKVQDVEDFPDDVERKWDNAVQDVEDVPEDIAGWAGNKVGDVERFGDNIDDAYDAGRNEARYDDDY